MNAADNVEAGIYLHHSHRKPPWEMGDDGAVGRGNSKYGLITSGRPMSLEATIGKKPINHVGKLYTC